MGTLVMLEVRSERAKKHYCRPSRAGEMENGSERADDQLCGRLEPWRGARLLEETDSGTGVPIPARCFPKNISLLEQGGRKYFLGV